MAVRHTAIGLAVVAAILALVFLGEPFRAPDVAGIGLAIGAVALLAT